MTTEPTSRQWCNFLHSASVAVHAAIAEWELWEIAPGFSREPAVYELEVLAAATETMRFPSSDRQS